MAGKTATAVHPGGQCRGGYEDGSCPLYGTGTVANCMTQGTRWRCTHRLAAPESARRATPSAIPAPSAAASSGAATGRKRVKAAQKK